MQDRKDTHSFLKLVSSGKPNVPTAAARVSRALLRKVTQEPGLGECSQLCDAFQMDRVCEQIPEAFFAARAGAKTGLALALRRNLIAPLQRFLPTLTVPRRNGRTSGVRMELQPTLDLIAAAEEVASRIEIGPWDNNTGRAASQLLRYTWAVWIAYVASFWITMEVPRRLVEKELQREHGSLGGKTPKNGLERKTGSAATIVAKYCELAKKMEPDDVAGAVARQLGFTATWVRRVWKKHSAATKAKQQATL